MIGKTNEIQLYVYDKDLNEFYTPEMIGKQSHISGLVSYVFSKNRLGFVEDPHMEIYLDRFIFLTNDDLESIVKNYATVRNLINDNKVFQIKYGFDAEPFDKDKLLFRNDLLTEEFNEIQDALKSKDAEEYVDGHIDLIVIALGNLFLAGVDINKAWSAVFEANMTKVRGVKPGREQSGGFDLIKPKGWKAPDHSDNHGDLENVL